MKQIRDLDSVKNVTKMRKFIGSTFFRAVVVFVILLIGVAPFVIKIVNAQAATFYPITIAADPLAGGTAIAQAARLDQNVNNYYSPNRHTTHTPPDPSNWSTAYWQVKDRQCPYGGANPVNGPSNNGDLGCGFGDALSTAAWKLRNNKTFCDNDRVDRIRVSWTVLNSDRSQADTDGLLGSLWDASAGALRNVETIPGGGGILSYNATMRANAGEYVIRGSGESSVSSILTVDDGTLGFKIDPGNLYVNDVNNRFTIYQWRDQSAGGYTNPNYQLKEVTTTPPTVELIFDHQPRFPDPVTGSCSPPAAPDKNYPYLQAQGDDVISGANFTTNGVCAAPSAASKNAKIYTNGFHGATTAESQDGSSNTQYGAWASGVIGSSAPGSNTFRANYGYVRNPSGSNEDIRDGLFANEKWTPPTSGYGNFYDGDQANPSLPCMDISDDIAGISSVGNSNGIAQSFLSTSSSGTLLVGPVSAIPQVIQNITIPAGVHKTLIVAGDVTIRGDIRYAPNYTSTTIPSLKIIAKNIYIESGVRTIDANIVALPEGSPLAGGIIDTCSNMVWLSNDTTSIGALPGQWPSNGKMTTSSCNTGNPGLVINGPIAARRILFKRTNGTLGPQSTAADPTCSFNIGIPATNPNALVQRYETCAAELIKFSPEAYISQLVNNLSATLQDVPVSTLELPPIN